MSRVTSKLQVTVPKAIADAYHITPGTELDWIPAGDVIRVVKSTAIPTTDEAVTRLRHFDEATLRQAARQKTRSPMPAEVERGWRREDLYGDAR